MGDSTSTLDSPDVIEMTSRLQETLGVDITPRINQKGNLEFGMPIPKGPDAQGMVINAMGVGNQLEAKLNDELNKDNSWLKRTFNPDQVNAVVFSGRGNATTSDLAIPADRAAQVLALAENVKKGDPDAFKTVFPEEMQVKASGRDTKDAPQQGVQKPIAIPEQDKALMQSLSGSLAPADRAQTVAPKEAGQDQAATRGAAPASR